MKKIGVFDLYLKKIHIQGFKSFADKTEIKFENNITAIVGPNGSGKSNISDAIRWVLGEQSVKSLRGNKMEDIIFSGTNKRRALSFAEVTIFFDNSDGMIPLEYNEVAVTRRMFRSGESEYYINKNACRLKDIRTLFMDTGIGKDGYSIIGQGRIDEILSNKPEDRRNIFEEAAGIIKYKSRKEESERKLKNTQENLIRINDLISEIEIQNKRLESDSLKASKFIEDFKELKDLETNLYIRDIRDIDNKSEKIRNQIESIENEIVENESKKDLNQDIFNILKKNIEVKEIEVEKLREKREGILKNKEEAKNNISLLNEKESYNRKDLERLNKEIDRLKDENLILDKENKANLKTEKELLEKLKDLTCKYEFEEVNLNKITETINLLEKDMDSKKKVMDSLYEGIADKRGKINNINSSNIDNEKEKESLYREKEILYKDVSKIEAKLQDLLENKEKLEKKLEIYLEKNQVNKEEQEILQVNIETISKKVRELEIQRERLDSSYKLYQNMQYTYEGYYKSVKNLLIAIKNKNIDSSGFHGVVADLLTVEKKYETAINISLGGNAQNIVVDNQEKAKYMINYLKKNKLGRVTFLPINTIRTNRQNINIKTSSEKGIIGLAYELIKYDKEYDNIFKSLLGRTIIMDNIDNSINFAKKTNNIHRIVTLEGEVLNPGGSLSGGSYRSNISIINRNTRIDELKIEIDELKKEISLYEDKKQAIENELEIYTNNIETEKVNIDNSRTNIIKLENQIRESENEKKYFFQDISRVEKQIQTIIKRSQETLENSTKDEESLKIELKEFEKNKKYIEKKTEDFKRIEFEKDHINKKTADIKLNIKLIENKLLNLKEEKDRNLDRRDYNNKLIKEKAENTRLIDKSLEEIFKEKETNTAILNEKIKRAEIIDLDIKDSSKDKEIYMKEFYKEQDNLKAINENISILSKERNDRELEISKLDLKKENIVTNLSDHYKLSLEEALELERPIDNIKDCRKKIKALKNNIKELGNVNLASIEEYKENNERYLFMKNQQDDLIESKEKLKNIIIDMEREMKTSFITSFEEIKINFSQVFSELFNGGVASLELEEDEDDILLAGIEIKVQPPGKALQSLSLLSGGEKSLVAVALLFAILKTKPAPFCVLDEIDAALDDANISKYTSYLKKINKESQFILITHRKTSMEIANVLYGVTMEEKGISRMISMKLEENKNELVS